MRRLAPVAPELAVVAGVLLVGGLVPAVLAARAGTGGLVVASILLLGGGIYFAVVARVRRGEAATLLARARPASDHRLEPTVLTVGRAVLDGLAGVVLAGLALLVDLGAIGVALVLGLGAYRLWQRAQVRRWERDTGRRLLREPSVLRGWLAPEHLFWVEHGELESSLPIVRAPRDPG
jgi:hypothetical protein